MPGFSRSIFATALILLSSTASSLSAPVGPTAVTNKDVIQVQYSNLCANWQRQCARLWGGGTQRWNECMNQPQALADCGRGGYGGGGFRSVVRGHAARP